MMDNGSRDFDVELHRVIPGPSSSDKLTSKIKKLLPLIGIFVGCGWLFQKGVTTDRAKKD